MSTIPKYRSSEEKAIRVIVAAEHEIIEGKGVRGDIRELLAITMSTSREEALG